MKWILAAAMTMALFLFPVQAQLEVPGLDKLWGQAEDYGVVEGTSLEEGLMDLVARVPAILGELLTAGVRTGARLLVVVLICSLGEGMQAAGTQSSLSAVRLAGALGITALTVNDVTSMIGLGRDTIGQMGVFSGVLLPVMAVLTAMTGGVTTAALRQGATVLFSRGLVTVMDTLLVPMVYAYVAVSCARTAAGNPGLDRLAQGIKSVVSGILTTLLVVFVGYLTASGAIAGSVDASRVKAARMAISRVIPVVGGILADASETVLAGAGILCGSVGAAGLLVVLTICLTPFLHLAAQYIIYKGTAALCAVIAQPELAKLIDTIGSAFGLVLGMAGAAALILLVSVVSATLTVTG